MHESLEATLRRLKEERDRADRQYNDALTALDRAVRPPPQLPGTPPAYDEHQITPLNESWNILPAPPVSGRATARLTGFVWRTIAPYLQRQLTFNSRLVDHINRNVAAHRDANRTIEELVTILREQLAHQAEQQSLLIAFLQQITPYIDTKDRDSAGGSLVLNAAVSALAESAAKRWESMAAREQRYESRAAALAAAHEDLRTAIAVAQQAALTVKREMERRIAEGESLGTQSSSSQRTAIRGEEAFAAPLDAYKYVGFENQFRGSREVIAARLESYIPFFEGAANVADLGCGRGEFLDLLRSRGITARGVDLNAEMVEVCRGRGLEVSQADAVGFLESVQDASLGGIFAAQVVEHLEPAYLLRLLDLSFHKLAPGAPLVLETLNPACWVAFFESYIRDITHVWPLHPETLQYLVVASGFTSAHIEYRSPVPEQDRLQMVASHGASEELQDVVETFNANVEKLNARMFTHLDYAIVARRP